jgi:hypothetical protein
MKQVRHAALVLGFVLALAPLSAFAEDGNQAAIDAAKAEKAWLAGMPAMQQGVALGQLEIANARAIAKLLYYDGHAQTELPNSMQQYVAFCGAAIQQVQAKVANANAIVMGKPWDPHAQAELANANAQMHGLWDMIGDSYAGNPYHSGGSVRSPLQVPVYGDDGVMLADDSAVVASDEEMVASDDEVIAVADTSVDDAVAGADVAN